MTNIIVLKGNFSQRQFDALNQVWTHSIGGEPISAIQLYSHDDQDIGVISVADDGSIELKCMFGSMEADPEFVNNFIELLDDVARQKLYEKMYTLGCRINK